MQLQGKDVEEIKASKIFLLHFSFPWNRQTMEKGDLGFGLGPATFSLCTLEIMILLCGPQFSHL